MNRYSATSLLIRQRKWMVLKMGDAIEELKNGFASGKRDENGIVQIRMNNVTTDGRLIIGFLKKEISFSTIPIA